jgi:hypothetical protein
MSHDMAFHKYIGPLQLTPDAERRTAVLARITTPLRFFKALESQPDAPLQALYAQLGLTLAEQAQIQAMLDHLGWLEDYGDDPDLAADCLHEFKRSLPAHMTWSKPVEHLADDILTSLLNFWNNPYEDDTSHHDVRGVPFHEFRLVWTASCANDDYVGPGSRLMALAELLNLLAPLGLQPV